MSDDRTKDEMLRRVRELREKADRSQSSSRRHHESAAERLTRDNTQLKRLHATADQLGGVLGPIGTFLSWVLRWFGRWLSWVAMVPPGDSATSGRFSIVRTIRNLLLSGLAVFSVLIIGKAVYFYGTRFEETVYVTGKQEIVTGELYQFGGCTSLPCSTVADNGKFYLIETSLYFPILLYPEEEVFANVPQQDGACNIQGYGIYFRTLRWIYKTFQLYQHVINVSCRPYTEAEIRQAVSDGEIVRDDPSPK